MADHISKIGTVGSAVVNSGTVSFLNNNVHNSDKVSDEKIDSDAVKNSVQQNGPSEKQGQESLSHLRNCCGSCVNHSSGRTDHKINNVSGTSKSLNNIGNGTQNCSGATVNSGESSGDRYNHHHHFVFNQYLPPHPDIQWRVEQKDSKAFKAPCRTDNESGTFAHHPLKRHRDSPSDPGVKRTRTDLTTMNAAPSPFPNAEMISCNKGVAPNTDLQLQQPTCPESEGNNFNPSNFIDAHYAHFNYVLKEVQNIETTKAKQAEEIKELKEKYKSVEKERDQALKEREHALKERDQALKTVQDLNGKLQTLKTLFEQVNSFLQLGVTNATAQGL